MFCSKCPTRSICTEICPKVNKLLKSQGIYSADWIRPEVYKKRREDGLGKFREAPVEDIDTVATQRAINIMGRKKSVKKYPETA